MSAPLHYTTVHCTTLIHSATYGSARLPSYSSANQLAVCTVRTLTSCRYSMCGASCSTNHALFRTHMFLTIRLLFSFLLFSLCYPAVLCCAVLGCDIGIDISCAAGQVLLGDSAVGKSSLVLRFVKRQFFEYQESTIGAAFLTQTVQLSDCVVKFEIWDTAGQVRQQTAKQRTQLHSTARQRTSAERNGGRGRVWRASCSTVGRLNVRCTLFGRSCNIRAQRTVADSCLVPCLLCVD